MQSFLSMLVNCQWNTQTGWPTRLCSGSITQSYFVRVTAGAQIAEDLKIRNKNIYLVFFCSSFGFLLYSIAATTLHRKETLTNDLKII